MTSETPRLRHDALLALYEDDEADSLNESEFAALRERGLQALRSLLHAEQLELRQDVLDSQRLFISQNLDEYNRFHEAQRAAEKAAAEEKARLERLAEAEKERKATIRREQSRRYREAAKERAAAAAAAAAKAANPTPPATPPAPPTAKDRSIVKVDAEGDQSASADSVHVDRMDVDLTAPSPSLAPSPGDEFKKPKPRRKSKKPQDPAETAMSAMQGVIDLGSPQKPSEEPLVSQDKPSRKRKRSESTNASEAASSEPQKEVKREPKRELKIAEPRPNPLAEFDLTPSICVTPECGETALPLAKHCPAHILSDPNQQLFKPCVFQFKWGSRLGQRCGFPVIVGPNASLCPAHTDPHKGEQEVARAAHPTSIRPSFPSDSIGKGTSQPIRNPQPAAPISLNPLPPTQLVQTFRAPPPQRPSTFAGNPPIMISVPPPSLSTHKSAPMPPTIGPHSINIRPTVPTVTPSAQMRPGPPLFSSANTVLNFQVPAPPIPNQLSSMAVQDISSILKLKPPSQVATTLPPQPMMQQRSAAQLAAIAPMPPNYGKANPSAPVSLLSNPSFPKLPGSQSSADWLRSLAPPAPTVGQSLSQQQLAQLKQTMQPSIQAPKK